jgi:hypothetical protein
VIYYKKIIEIQQSIQPNDLKELYSTNFVIASIYLKKESYRNAMIYYERSFDYAKEYLPEKHYIFVLLYNNIGYTHQRLTVRGTNTVPYRLGTGRYRKKRSRARRYGTRY